MEVLKSEQDTMIQITNVQEHKDKFMYPRSPKKKRGKE
jgi:hypothetical protein